MLFCVCAGETVKDSTGSETEEGERRNREPRRRDSGERDGLSSSGPAESVLFLFLLLLFFIFIIFSHLLDVCLSGDANRQISDLKFKLVKTEQEVTAMEQNVQAHVYIINLKNSTLSAYKKKNLVSVLLNLLDFNPNTPPPSFLKSKSIVWVAQSFYLQQITTDVSFLRLLR